MQVIGTLVGQMGIQVLLLFFKDFVNYPNFFSFFFGGGEGVELNCIYRL